VTQTPYNPLDIPNLSESIVRALMEQTPRRMDQLGSFLGAGIYAIYYTGNHPAYARLTSAHADEPFQVPIYVGKAVPSGSRIGLDVGESALSGALRSRLGNHADSIQAAANLDLSHFYARWLVVDSVWIPLGENLLISRYKPVWNNKLHGFGNKDPGIQRLGGKVPKWDVLHTGRDWAGRLTGSRAEYRDMYDVVVSALDAFFVGDPEDAEPDGDEVEL